MKKTLLFLALLLFAGSAIANDPVGGAAQVGQTTTEVKKETAQSDKVEDYRKIARDKIKALKVGYFTDKVGLTTSESEKFWPIYNAYWSDRRDSAHQMRDLFHRVENGTARADELTLFLALKDSENALLRRWAEQFKTVLTPEKVIKVFVAEESFKRFLLDKRDVK